MQGYETEYSIIPNGLLELFRQVKGKDLLPSIGPVEGERYYLRKALKFLDFEILVQGGEIDSKNIDLKMLRGILKPAKKLLKDYCCNDITVLTQDENSKYAKKLKYLMPFLRLINAKVAAGWKKLEIF